ncbi:MAG: acyltransferase [Bacteroidales bacterium]|nr:acyltransferase [Bacteroidales bacterium]
MTPLKERIFTLESKEDFEECCLQVFKWQYECNAVYKKWCELLNRKPENTTQSNQIPFLPISFFRTHKVVSFSEEPKGFFMSSGTASSIRSRHWIRDYSTYERSFSLCFERFFGNVEQYCFIAILPNYQEQANSSLIYMIDHLVKSSRQKDSGFYPYDIDKVASLLHKNENEQIPTILFGVSYALLDLAEKHRFNLKHTTVFETGGMKGRRKEISKRELHSILCNAFGTDSIASEYGMCELFSQAYAVSDGSFRCPPWLKVSIKETNDPFSECKQGKSGIINIIDLANIDSCSFIATEDLGRINTDGSFEVLGRADNSVVKGCNLMYEQ